MKSWKNRFLTKKDERERFSVSTQHFTFAIEAFTNVIKKFDPQKFVFSIHGTKTKAVLDDVRDFKSEVGIVSYSSANKALMKKTVSRIWFAFTPLMQRESIFMYGKIMIWQDVKKSRSKKCPILMFVSIKSVERKPVSQEEAMADHVFESMIKSDDRATSMGKILREARRGYSIGSGLCFLRKDGHFYKAERIKPS
ncbi:hypothetical protein [Dubosiella newyorkensis]|uniref:hypothetical protein n=1 Tax=Dubosiella newyorkensis TaxID=1862672 RepID=UPI003F67714C